MAKRQLIEINIQDSLTKRWGSQITSQPIEEAIDYLERNIVAALSFGDMYLLGNNMDWIGERLAGYGFLPDWHFSFLEAFHNALESQMGQAGQPITAWTGKILASTPSSS